MQWPWTDVHQRNPRDREAASCMRSPCSGRTRRDPDLSTPQSLSRFLINFYEEAARSSRHRPNIFTAETITRWQHCYALPPRKIRRKSRMPRPTRCTCHRTSSSPRTLAGRHKFQSRRTIQISRPNGRHARPCFLHHKMHSMDFFEYAYLQDWRRCPRQSRSQRTFAALPESSADSPSQGDYFLHKGHGSGHVRHRTPQCERSPSLSKPAAKLRPRTQSSPMEPRPSGPRALHGRRHAQDALESTATAGTHRSKRKGDKPLISQHL